jgi:hypothetical protein
MQKERADDVGVSVGDREMERADPEGPTRGAYVSIGVVPGESVRALDHENGIEYDNGRKSGSENDVFTSLNQQLHNVAILGGQCSVEREEQSTIP